MRILVQGAHFEPCVNKHIYFSPLMKGGIGDHEVITVGWFDAHDIKIGPGTSIEEVIEQLPEGFEPDLYLVQGPEYNPPPEGLHRAPFPTVGTIYDHDYCVAGLHHRLRELDAVVTYGAEAAAEARALGARHVIEFPLIFGFDPEMLAEAEAHLEDPEHRRDIDIFFAGGIDDRLHPDRSQLLLRLAELAGEREVMITGYMSPESYARTLARSRLVFTYHRRGELQTRAYEGMAAGAVGACLKSPEAEALAGDDSMVHYGLESLEADLLSALEPERLAELSARGQALVREEKHDCYTRLIAFLDSLEAQLPELQTLRSGRRVLSRYELAAAYYAYFPFASFPDFDRSDILDRAEQLVTEAGHAGEIRAAEAFNALGVITHSRTTLPIDEADEEASGRAANDFGQRAIRFLDKALEADPSWASAALNLGYVCLRCGVLGAAEKAFRYAARLFEDPRARFDAFDLFCGEQQTEAWTHRRSYNDVLLQRSRAASTGARDAATGQLRRILGATASFLAAEAILVGERRAGERIAECLALYADAVKRDPERGALRYRYALAATRAGEATIYREQLEAAHRLLPMDMTVVMRLTRARAQAGEIEAAKQLVERYRKAARAVRFLAPWKADLDATAERPTLLTRQPQVSVVLPVWNYEQYIESAVRSALEQTWERTELVVVDHGSTDRTPQVLAALEREYGERMRVVRIARDSDVHDTTTPLNHAIYQARGELIAWLNADDRFSPEKLRAQAEALASRPQVGMCYTDYYCEVEPDVDRSQLQNVSPEARRRIEEGGCIRNRVTCPVPHPLETWARLLESNFIIASTVMFRRELWERFGGFDARYPQVQDYHFWLRVLAEGRGVHHIAEPLATFRVHGGNTSKWKNMVPEEAAMVREIVDGVPIERIFPVLQTREGETLRAECEARFAHIIARRGLYERARQHALESLRLKPERADLHNLLAWIAVQEGDAEQARSELRRAVHAARESWRRASYRKNLEALEDSIERRRRVAVGRAAQSAPMF